jgi:hypothetical protein
MALHGVTNIPACRFEMTWLVVINLLSFIGHFVHDNSNKYGQIFRNFLIYPFLKVIELIFLRQPPVTLGS